MLWKIHYRLWIFLLCSYGFVPLSCGQYCEKCCGNKMWLLDEMIEKSFSIICQPFTSLDTDMLWISWSFYVFMHVKLSRIFQRKLSTVSV